MSGTVIPLRPAGGQGEINILSFERAGKPGSALRGHATLHLPRIRLKLLGCACFHNEATGEDRVLPPSRPLLDGEGRIRRDANGRALYAPVLEWDGRDLQVAFSWAAVAALDRYEPNWRGRT